MAKHDDFAWAAAAWRETLRREVIKCVASFERRRRKFAASPTTRMEAAEQKAYAESLRQQAREEGLL